MEADMNNNGNNNNKIETVFVKEWFMAKIKMDNNGWGFKNNSGEIVRETAKAYLLKMEAYTIDGEFEGFLQIWAPKSCTVETPEELDQENQRQNEYEAKRQERYEAACKAYQELIEYAKKMGVKGVREGLRKETILRKIQNAGVAVPVL